MKISSSRKGKQRNLTQVQITTKVFLHSERIPTETSSQLRVEITHVDQRLRLHKGLNSRTSSLNVVVVTQLIQYPRIRIAVGFQPLQTDWKSSSRRVKRMTAPQTTNKTCSKALRSGLQSMGVSASKVISTASSQYSRFIRRRANSNLCKFR